MEELRKAADTVILQVVTGCLIGALLLFLFALLCGCSTLHSNGLPAFCPYDNTLVHDVTSPTDFLPQAQPPPGYVVLHGQCEGFGPSGEGYHDFFVTNRVSAP